MPIGGTVRFPFRKTIGVALVLVVSFSCYLMMVQIVNTFAPQGILKSFSVSAPGRRDSLSEFRMGDTLTVKAESDVGSSYDLEVYQNTSVIHEVGVINQSSFSVDVPLCPPAFGAHEQYLLVFDIKVLNKPIPGAFFAQSASSNFQTTSASTNINLATTYDRVAKSLCATANLTNVDNSPIANQRVYFYLQFPTEHMATDGWFLIGSALSDTRGIAGLSTAFSDPFNQQARVKASYDGNENFGSSTTSTNLNVTSNSTASLHSNVPSYGQAALSFRAEDTESGTVSLVQVDNATPYAGLPLHATFSYTSTSPVNTSNKFNDMIFYQDFMNSSPGIYLGNDTLKLTYSNSSYYVYEASITALFNVTGSHCLIAGVMSGCGLDWDEAVLYGIGIIASANTTLNIQPCPGNIVMNVAQASYGNALDVSVAFAMPRLYNVSGSGGFTSYSLAPQLQYDGESYMMDNPPFEPVPVQLNVNGSQAANVSTNAGGVASVPLQVNFSGTQCSMNLTTVMNDSGFIYQWGSLSRGLCITRVNVTSDLNQTCSVQLTWSVNGQPGSDGQVYVDADNPATVKVGLSGMPISAAPASMVIGKIANGGTCPTRSYTTSSGLAQFNSTSTQLLRVDSVYTPANLGRIPVCDFKHEGEVGLGDLVMLAVAYNSQAGGSKYRWFVDADLDMEIGLGDLVILALNYNHTCINYMSIVDYSVVTAAFYLNGGGQENVSLDSSGCVSVPQGATGWVGFSVGGSSVGAVFDCFRSVLNQTSGTDNCGDATVSWTPTETGTNDTRTSYVALAWLPSTFSVLTTQSVSSTVADAPLCVVDFINVTMRPTSLTLTNSSYECDTPKPLPPCTQDTYTLNGNVEDFNGSSQFLYVGYNDAGTLPLDSYVQFDVSSIPTGSLILSAALKLYACSDDLNYGSGNEYFGVGDVSSSWNEAWPAQLQNSTDPICLLQAGRGREGWWVWDVTGQVQSWRNGSANNGFCIWVYPYATWNGAYAFYSLESNSDASLKPSLEVTYVPPNCTHVGLQATLVDDVNGSAIPNANVTLSLNGAQYPLQTNQSGVASMNWSVPAATAAYNAVANFSGEGAIYEGSSDSLWLDYRINTGLVVMRNGDGQLGPGDVYNVSTYTLQTYVCGVTLYPDFQESLSLYVNGTLNATATIGVGKNATFTWNPCAVGVYYLNVTYGGDQYYKLAQINFSVVTYAGPVSMGFSVSPTTFAPGDNVTLSATAVNPLTSKNDTNLLIEFFDNNTNVVNGTTDQNGVANVPWRYPPSGIHTIIAHVAPGSAVANVTLMVQPITLTVGQSTALLLWTTLNYSSGDQIIQAQLLNGATPLGGQAVTVTVNNTSYVLTTNSSDGTVSLSGVLTAVDNNATFYQITASFNGTNLQTLNSTTFHDPYGRSYLPCTTVQYDLLPASNATMLTVYPQSTDGSTVTETTDQLQHQAQGTGFFNVKAGFSFGYPWFTLHYLLNVNLPQGNPSLDYGWSPLPFGCSYGANMAVLMSIATNTVQVNPGATALFFGTAVVPLAIQQGVAYVCGDSLAGIVYATVIYVCATCLFTWWAWERSMSAPSASVRASYWLMALFGAAFIQMFKLFVMPNNLANLISLLSTIFSSSGIESFLTALGNLVNSVGIINILGAIFALVTFSVMALYASWFIQALGD